MIGILIAIVAERVGTMGADFEIGKLLTTKTLGFDGLDNLLGQGGSIGSSRSGGGRRSQRGLFTLAFTLPFAHLFGLALHALLVGGELHGVEFDETLHGVVGGETVDAVDERVLLATNRTVDGEAGRAVRARVVLQGDDAFLAERVLTRQHVRVVEQVHANGTLEQLLQLNRLGRLHVLVVVVLGRRRR